MARSQTTFLLKHDEAQELAKALRVIAAGDYGDPELREIGRVADFATQIEAALKDCDAPHVKLCLKGRVWKGIMSINCDLTLNSPYGDDDDHPESKAIDLVEQFLVMSGRRLGTSIFRSPKDRRAIERATGLDLRHLDL